MDNSFPTDSRSPRRGEDDPYTRPPTDSGKANDFNLGEVVANIWEGRYLILGSVLCFLIVGILYAWTASPVYKVEGLLQAETQKTFGSQNSEFTKIEGAYSKIGRASCRERV